MTKYLLAHDIGTSGDKATLFTTDGELVDSKTSPYKTIYPKHNWAEQNPEDWWSAVCSSTQELIKNIEPGDVAVISFSGQMMGCLCVDVKGTPLRNSIIYCDQRGEKEVEIIKEKIDPFEFYNVTGHRISAVYSIEKLLWIKNNQPDIFRNTHKMLNAKDFIIHKLCGEYVTDHSDASGTNAYDLAKRDWSEVILEASGIDRSKLPDIYPSTHVVGTVSKGAEKETGLKFGTPIVVGAGDGSAVAVGVGCIKPGSAYTYLGSSAWVGTAANEALIDERMRTMTWAHAVPDLFHLTGSMQAAGTSYQWVKDEICLFETKQAQENHVDPFDMINAEIALSVPGANGIIFLPYLMGERSPHWNPNAKGAFIGIKLANKRQDILRSVLEGISFNLNLILNIFKSKIDVNEMTLVGGGAQADVWQQIIADIFETKTLIPNHMEEATAIGAAVIGGVGVGSLHGFNEIKKFISITKTIEPKNENREIYRRTADFFIETYNALVDVFDKY
jgi:xylulokinase